MPLVIPSLLQETSFENPIVGGSGAFTGAEGYVHIEVLEAGEAWAYTIYLDSPAHCDDHHGSSYGDRRRS